MNPIQTDTALSFAHLTALTAEYGVYEHARGRTPAVEHGHCTDDVARALTVVVREPEPTPELVQHAESYLDFLERAITPTGEVHNRRSATGEWTDTPGTGDWWGRAVAGLGAAVRHGVGTELGERALVAFRRAAIVRSEDVRACSFAVVGAADVWRTLPEESGARELMLDCLGEIPRRPTGGWGWPEPRLRYANAALCSALIVGGDAQQREPTIKAGLAMLTTLLRIETGPTGQLSVTGTEGRGPTDPSPQWDQQPIEPSAIADACLHALNVTRDPRWARQVLRAWEWFTGANDVGVAMIDPESGAGYDGLHLGGHSDNCGAESTLAAISTHQNARSAGRWLR